MAKQAGLIPNELGDAENEKTPMVRHAPWFDSEAFMDAVRRLETGSKWILFILLVWGFFAGSKNMDYIWSYLGVVQLIAHMAALKIQYPINATLTSRSMLSIGVLDIKEVQSEVLKNSLFDVSQYLEPLLRFIEPPVTISQKDVEREISNYQLYELEYREQVSFFDNLRSMKVFLFASALLSVVSLIGWLVCRPCRDNWIVKAMQERVWTYMGVNALFRILILEYSLCIYAGWVTLRKQILLVTTGEVESLKMDLEFTSFAFIMLVPAILLLILPCLSKDTLRHPVIESSVNTTYAKANLRSKWSKAYPLFLLL